MSEPKAYNSLEEVLNYFILILPHIQSNRIASVSKYARIGDTALKIEAIRQGYSSSLTWSFEITIGITA